MQFIDNAPFYKLARVTGPKHNLLVLKLASTRAQGEVAVERLDTDRECVNPITDEEVREQVVRAISDYHAEFGANRFVELVQYLGGDSRPVETYYMMTREILRRVEGAAVQ